MLHLIWSIIVGFIVGLIARAIMPGVDQYGFWMTVIIGVVGSLIGGIIGMLIKRPPAGTAFHPAGFVLSIVGALILLWVIQHFHLMQ
jgi:uncharacterized membrane protein YeaQ/YmgE (transglycosylase-associated protein family)